MPNLGTTEQRSCRFYLFVCENTQERRDKLIKRFLSSQKPYDLPKLTEFAY